MITHQYVGSHERSYEFGLLDRIAKKEIRRTTLKAIAIPGHIVPFASREMPIARGFGTGGLQVTLSIIGKDDTLKVIDQGADESVNACSIRELVKKVCPALQQLLTPKKQPSFKPDTVYQKHISVKIRSLFSKCPMRTH